MKYINTIFNQMLNLLPRYEFDKEVVREEANRYTKHFTAWNQLLVNLYAQITGKKSLRDIECIFRSKVAGHFNQSSRPFQSK